MRSEGLPRAQNAHVKGTITHDGLENSLGIFLDNCKQTDRGIFDILTDLMAENRILKAL